MTTTGTRRLFLIDASNLVHRYFHATRERPRRAPDGTDIGVLFGVHAWLSGLLEEHRPEAIAWVEDAGDSGRKQLDPNYKGARVRMEEPDRAIFQASIRQVEELLLAWRIPRLRVPGFEADDVMATMAKRVADKDWTAVCVGHDKDLVQMVGPRIQILMPGRGGAKPIPDTWLTETTAVQRLGVPPHQVVDFLALNGDGSDSVPGVKGVGEKGAVSLLATWGTLENILAHVDEVEPKRYREPLRQGAESARLSKRLVTLQMDVPVAQGLDLRLGARDEGAYQQLLQRYGLRAKPQPAWLEERRMRAPIVPASDPAPEGSLSRSLQATGAPSAADRVPAEAVEGPAAAAGAAERVAPTDAAVSPSPGPSADEGPRPQGAPMPEPPHEAARGGDRTPAEAGVDVSPSPSPATNVSLESAAPADALSEAAAAAADTPADGPAAGAPSQSSESPVVTGGARQQLSLWGDDAPSVSPRRRRSH